MSASAVIAALRARLVAADYDVVLFRTIGQGDELPLVGVHFTPDGEQSDTERPFPGQQEVELDVILVSEAVSDHQVEAVGAAEALRDVLVQHRADRLDSLDGACDSIRVVRMRVDTREQQTNVLVSHVRVRAAY